MFEELWHRWQGTWHEVFGHPRPWLILDEGTYCDSCHKRIKVF